MKRVRFESPIKGIFVRKMEENDCHSPRPFIERQVLGQVPDIQVYPKVLPYSSDPVQLYECSNSSPYPIVNKTAFASQEQLPQWSPCSDLEISFLDATNNEPRKPTFSRSILKSSELEKDNYGRDAIKCVSQNKVPVLKSTENKSASPPNMLIKDDDFFIKRTNLGNMNFDINPIQNKFSQLNLDKENNPLTKKAQIIQMTSIDQEDSKRVHQPPPADIINGDCRCHHCIKATNIYNINRDHMHYQQGAFDHHYVDNNTPVNNHCRCGVPPPPRRCVCCDYKQCQQKTCVTMEKEPTSDCKMNAVDKKTWAIEKYEQSNKSSTMEIETQKNVTTKEKREPTVSDLFKIIKLQNEQLQLLQEKVDKFISASQQNQNLKPVQSYTSEHVHIASTDSKQHQISIGVMTSFELVRTSTIINKEVVKTQENAQIQCNRSQISIKEVVSKAQSPNLNFLDGIQHVPTLGSSNSPCPGISTNQDNINDEKTLNEMSLYNVQVDNSTTPMMSPEQSLYLDVRDYSNSDADSDAQSNVGWTYYNKVMSHVNGMLQDSDMPSSASALYRNTRQQLQTVQMQIDKTNVSVTKRVKFGDETIHQHQGYAASTDTSMKMNQLAAKYLKGGPPTHALPQPAARPAGIQYDMSFATRNYMERHKLLQNGALSSKALHAEMPRFLDITALKQQPKFL